MKQQLVKIEFKGHRRQYFPNVMEYPITRGDYLVVQTEKGEDLGQVTAVTEKCDGCPQEFSYHILRKADKTDLTEYFENRRSESEAKLICQERVAELKLEMKLMDVEYQLDRKKITFYYTADDRVDFRELVRLLAAIFRTRIEMRQIGVRDEAKRIESVGTCGLPLCCSKFLESFEPVNTQTAKDQNLPMNPTKLSGQCGKLKCCLRFEHPFYLEEMKRYPGVGQSVLVKNQAGCVEKIDIITEMVTCMMDDDTRTELNIRDIGDALQAARDKGIQSKRTVRTEILDGDVSDLNRIEDK